MPRKVNTKKRMISAPGDDAVVLADLHALSLRVRYGGNPDHKRNPGDFNLSPPSNPRTAKSLCDEAGVFTRAEAERLLRRGVELGLVSEQRRNGWPQNIWAVAASGVAVEAMLENETLGTYHGYPMSPDEAFVAQVHARWVP